MAPKDKGRDFFAQPSMFPPIYPIPLTYTNPPSVLKRANSIVDLTQYDNDSRAKKAKPTEVGSHSSSCGGGILP